MNHKRQFTDQDNSPVARGLEAIGAGLDLLEPLFELLSGLLELLSIL